MAPKRYDLRAVVAASFLVSCSVFALGVAFAGAVLDRDFTAVGALIPIFVALAAGLGVAFSLLGRKSLRPSNYPRIEHLRIAGKYQGTAAEMGISPLHLGR